MAASSNRRMKIGLYAVSAVLLFAVLLCGVFMSIEWRPEQLESTAISGGGANAPRAGDGLSVLSWNIGYAGLGKDADFFMDGGKQVRPPSKQLVQENLHAIEQYLSQNLSDVLFLQEVDRSASRTFGINQIERLSRELPDYFYGEATNFRVPWVPVPLLRPMGKVHSGLLTLSRFPLEQALRHQLPGDYSWPVRVFHLKRCLHEVRTPAADGKDWVFINLHLSAFDKGGHLRKQQMAYLKQLVLKIHGEGHHVVVGGDWNQAFPGIDVDSFAHRAQRPSWFQLAPADWAPPGWQWAFDPKVPSLRANNTPYTAGQNFVTSVDGFLLSPDIELLSVECVDLQFENSDHQPVHLKIQLKGTAGSQPGTIPDRTL